MKMRKINNLLLLALLGIVSIAVTFGGCSTTGNNKPNTTSANKTPVDNKAALELYAKAPAGAQPPNTLGPATATVTIEEFADYQCPTCAAVHTKMKEINSLYSGRIKFVFRSFPLQMHKNAYDAAVAAEAAGQQGKYWAMQDQLFTNQTAWANSSEVRKIFDEYAQKIGLDVAKFQTDMAGLITKNRVDADLARGRALVITGTPTVYINGNKLSYEQTDVNPMRQIIDAELQKATSQPQSNAPANQAPANQTSTNSAANQSTNTAIVNK